MKKELRYLFFIYVLGMVFCFGSGVYAQPDTPQDPPTPVTAWEDIISLINYIRNLVYFIGGSIALIMFIWAGVTFMTAEGDPDKLKAARQRLIYGVIGVIIILMAGGIFTLLESFLGQR